MKKKIAYLTITAVIGMTAFFSGKNFSTTTTEPETVQPETIQAETKTPELTEMTVEDGGLYLEYSDGNHFYSYWIESADLEKAGLIDTENIIDWNTDGEELAIMTENGYEWYAYQSAEIYQNRNFVPVEK